MVDTLPADLGSASWTCTAAAGSSCAAANGTGSINSTVSLLVGGSATYTLTATASGRRDGQHRERRDGGSTRRIIDPALGNNSATDTDTRPGGSYHTLSPCRVLDTRDPSGPFGAPPLSASTSRPFTVAGRCGIPTTATALSINLTVTDGTAPGFVVASPTGSGAPTVSSINYSAGQTRANNAVVGIGAGDQIDLTCGQATGTVNAIVDVSGYFVE